MSKKKEKIQLPDRFEIYKSIRKESVPPSQSHKPKKGKGSYDRKKKHSKKEI